jgi:hypothetical protein
MHKGTKFSHNMLQRIVPFVDSEYLTLPILLVVGQHLDHLQVPPVAALSCLGRAVFPPSKENDVMYYVSKQMVLEELPGQRLPCRGNSGVEGGREEGVPVCVREGREGKRAGGREKKEGRKEGGIEGGRGGLLSGGTEGGRVRERGSARVRERESPRHLSATR